MLLNSTNCYGADHRGSRRAENKSCRFLRSPRRDRPMGRQADHEVLLTTGLVSRLRPFVKYRFGYRALKLQLLFQKELENLQRFWMSTGVYQNALHQRVGIDRDR